MVALLPARASRSKVITGTFAATGTSPLITDVRCCWVRRLGDGAGRCRSCSLFSRNELIRLETCMRILLINPPHPSIGSRIPREQLPPLGLLSIGGPLIDAGHQVELLDAEFGPMRLVEIVRRTVAYRPDAILLGHSGSTSGHPIVVELTRALRAAMAQPWIIYGGVFPTYHWREILAQEPQIDFIVRGEGEETTQRLIRVLETGGKLLAVRGIGFRDNNVVIGTQPAPVIEDLDACRVGWELIDHKHYSYWGGKRAVVVQFSRGCPHLCNYCGQRGFWTRFRHRDPKTFAAEIARLHREHEVEVINFADENPSA